MTRSTSPFPDRPYAGPHADPPAGPGSGGSYRVPGPAESTARNAARILEVLPARLEGAGRDDLCRALGQLVDATQSLERACRVMASSAEVDDLARAAELLAQVAARLGEAHGKVAGEPEA